MPAEMPHSREAEEAVIGSIFINPELHVDLSAIITTPDAFFLHRLRFIWDAFDRLARRQVPIDYLTVCEELNATNQLAEIGGPAYIMALINQVPTTLHAESYAQICVSNKLRRDLLHAANQIATLAYNMEIQADEAATQAVSAIVDASASTMTSTIKTAQEVFSRVYDHVDQLSRQPAEILPGVPTGLTDLNRLLSGGWQKQKLYTIGARPGKGKSSLLATAVHHAAFELHKKVLYFSMEMDDIENGIRLLSIDQRLDGQVLSTGKVSDDQWSKFTTGIENGAYATFYLDDCPVQSPASLRAKAKRIKALYGIDLIIVDYLGLMHGNGKFENRVQEMSSISRGLKILAREMDAPVVCAHQLSRAVEGRAENRPQLSDLRESGSVEQDSDAVLFIFEDKDTPNVSHIEVAKHRGGPTGTIDTLFQKQFTKFSDLATFRARL